MIAALCQGINNFSAQRKLYKALQDPSYSCNINCVRNGKKLEGEHICMLMKTNRCIDCVNEQMKEEDLSYEALKKNNFSLWFIAIAQGRPDIIESLIRHGAERFKEYKTPTGYDSYSYLIFFWKMNGFCPFVHELIELFLKYEIPVEDDFFLKCSTSFLDENGIPFLYYSAVYNKLKKYGYKIDLDNPVIAEAKEKYAPKRKASDFVKAMDSLKSYLYEKKPAALGLVSDENIKTANEQ